MVQSKLMRTRDEMIYLAFPSFCNTQAHTKLQHEIFVVCAVTDAQ